MSAGLARVAWSNPARPSTPIVLVLCVAHQKSLLRTLRLLQITVAGLPERHPAASCDQCRGRAPVPA